MTETGESKIPQILKKHEKSLLSEWMEAQVEAVTLRPDLLDEDVLRRESAGFLSLLREAAQSGNLDNIQASEWEDVRAFLSDLSRSRVEQGFSPSETTTFIFSLKQPLFARLGKELAQTPETLAAELWTATALLDKLGLYTNDVYLQNREGIIARQRDELIELSTPVVRLWDGILAVPLIGTLDSARTQVVMENLLQAIVDTGSTIAIIDITGVPAVDTLVAQHLLKTVAAARLMGAECLISGVRPQIAQTVVALGVDLSDVVTKASLADAFVLALKQLGVTITRNGNRS